MSQKTKPLSRSYFFLLVLGVSLLGALVTSYITNQALGGDVEERTAATHVSEYKQKRSLIVHIASSIEDNPHAVFMGMNKAIKSKEAGMPTMVFFDVKATSTVLKATDSQFADFPSSASMIKTLIAKGVDVYVCPHCLMVNGGAMKDVQEGIKPLQPDTLVRFEPETNPITLDY